jgi:hypothetical protein
MNQLWSLIKVQQIIFLLPLLLIPMPANVQLLYSFMNQNMNMQIVPSTVLSV